METKDLATIETKTGAELYRQSTDAAGLCKAIVVNTAVQISGKKYVRVEGWQAIAVAHGCIASAREVKELPNGFSAIGEVRRMSDGLVIATAEGFVGKDEAVWFGGESNGKKYPARNEYAIRAMAQTRAISRACRSAFAHVVVMMNAGLSTTPAEEVPEGGFEQKPTPSPADTPKPTPEPEVLSPEEAAAVFGGEAENSNPVVCHIDRITAKTGTANNKPWKLYIVHTSKGEYGTFDSKVAKYAEEAAANGKSVSIAWEPTGKGNKNIVSLT